MNTALSCGHLPCWLVLQEVGKESITENSCCSISSEQSGQTGVGQMMCKVTRARCHSDVTSFGEHIQGGQLGLLWSLWWDMCPCGGTCVPCPAGGSCGVPLPVGAAVMERSHFPAHKCVRAPPSICSQPAAKGTTINKRNEKCNPVFILKERVEITDSL